VGDVAWASESLPDRCLVWLTMTRRDGLGLLRSKAVPAVSEP